MRQDCKLLVKCIPLRNIGSILDLSCDVRSFHRQYLKKFYFSFVLVYRLTTFIIQVAIGTQHRIVLTAVCFLECV